MGTALEDLRVLQAAEAIADNIWQIVLQWDEYPRRVVGEQYARAADSIGANIAEAYGRYHYGDKLQFLYYARGSLFESKYWLNRAIKRNLIPTSTSGILSHDLSALAIQLNNFARSLKVQRTDNKVREPDPEYALHSDLSVPERTQHLIDEISQSPNLPITSSLEYT